MGNYSATSNNMKLLRRPLMGELLHLVQRSRRGLVGSALRFSQRPTGLNSTGRVESDQSPRLISTQLNTDPVVTSSAILNILAVCPVELS